MTGVAADSLVAVSREGVVRALPGMPPAPHASPRFSHDGTLLALCVRYLPPSGNLFRGDIWVYDPTSRTSTRLTFDSLSGLPEWTADGRAIAVTRSARPVPEFANFSLAKIAGDGRGGLDTVFTGA